MLSSGNSLQVHNLAHNLAQNADKSMDSGLNDDDEESKQPNIEKSAEIICGHPLFRSETFENDEQNSSIVDNTFD